jgi:hypothetical protein
MQVILAGYAAFGLVFLSGLALTARSVREWSQVSEWPILSLAGMPLVIRASYSR